MFRDRIVRCRVTAVDESNVAGYTRVSEPVRLVHVPQEACSASDDISKLVVTGKLTSHTSGVLSLDVSGRFVSFVDVIMYILLTQFSACITLCILCVLFKPSVDYGYPAFACVIQSFTSVILVLLLLF